jgi:hypothetical protein
VKLTDRLLLPIFKELGGDLVPLEVDGIGSMKESHNGTEIREESVLVKWVFNQRDFFLVSRLAKLSSHSSESKGYLERITHYSRCESDD